MRKYDFFSVFMIHTRLVPSTGPLFASSAPQNYNLLDCGAEEAKSGPVGGTNLVCIMKELFLQKLKISPNFDIKSRCSYLHFANFDVFFLARAGPPVAILKEFWERQESEFKSPSPSRVVFCDNYLSNL